MKWGCWYTWEQRRQVEVERHGNQEDAYEALSDSADAQRLYKINGPGILGKAGVVKLKPETNKWLFKVKRASSEGCSEKMECLSCLVYLV